MIFVSSSCVKAKTIAEAVEKLNDKGYYAIELSGGTILYPELKEDLLRLKENGNTFICHNYFPPPSEAFVVNLASLDKKTFQASLSHLQNAIELSKELGANRFGFHAGFLINIPIHEMGKQVSRSELFDAQKAMEQFCLGFELLKKHAGTLELYLENNVLSTDNFRNFNRQNPFFLCRHSEYEEMKQKIDFKLLLDVAHLKVSSSALGLDFESELRSTIAVADYIHISDNNGLMDSNQALQQGSDLYNLLKKLNLRDKTITLEVYEGDEALKTSYLCIQELIQ